MTPALVVVDVQRALCAGPQAPFEAGPVVARIAALARRARAAGAPVVFVQHEGKNGYLEFGSEGWALAAGLGAEPGDVFVRKTTADSFHRTALAALLGERGVSELVVCGMHTEFCIDTTARRALALGFAVVLVADAHTTLGNDHLAAPQVIAHHNATLAAIASFGPRLRAVPASEVRFQDGAGALSALRGAVASSPPSSADASPAPSRADAPPAPGEAGGIRVERCASLGHPGWLDLRQLLWSDASASEHTAEMATFLAAPERFIQLVACLGTIPVGLAEAAIRHDYVNGTDTSPVAFLEGLFVVPPQRRRGIAARLVAAVAAWAKERGCTELASDAGLDNAPSHAVHRALGFRETERVVFFHKSLSP